MRAAAITTGNHEDTDYDDFIGLMNERFRSIFTKPGMLFTTDVEGLFETYLSGFPEEERKYHNCNTCRRFIERFGGLVSIDALGDTEPAIWSGVALPGGYSAAVLAMIRTVRRAKVTGVFLSDEKAWGRFETGVWHHYAITPPAEMLYRPTALKSTHQAMAEKTEEFGMVRRALVEFSAKTLEQALELLKSDILYRSEKVLGQAEWLATLKTAFDFCGKSAARGRQENHIWRAVAMAPAGFCHPRSSMIGTLLEDLESGKSLEECSRSFAVKMDPLKYQRPQAAPTSGALARAEKVVAELGVAGALARRFARLDEIQTIWLPQSPPAGKGGVFGHLLPKEEQAPAQGSADGGTITVEKFLRTVLPDAVSIEARTPSHGPYAAYLTAVNTDAPPIIQWDSPEDRNPFTWYQYMRGSSAAQWGVPAGAWMKVTGVSLQPSMWRGEMAHQGKGVLFVLAGAKDSGNAGLGLFPELLKAELREIRSALEAYSAAGQLEGREQASACGLLFQARGGSMNQPLRVTTKSGTRFEYRLDRWD
jgi:hypothetical protein